MTAPLMPQAVRDGAVRGRGRGSGQGTREQHHIEIILVCPPWLACCDSNNNIIICAVLIRGFDLAPYAVALWGLELAEETDNQTLMRQQRIAKQVYMRSLIVACCCRCKALLVAARLPRFLNLFLLTVAARVPLVGPRRSAASVRDAGKRRPGQL